MSSDATTATIPRPARLDRPLIEGLTPTPRQCRRCGSTEIRVVDRLVPVVLGRASDDARAAERVWSTGKRVGARVDNGRAEVDLQARALGVELGVLRRRRECLGCRWRWSTFEVREADLSAVLGIAAAKAEGAA
jgi:hypothetical protein